MLVVSLTPQLVSQPLSTYIFNRDDGGNSVTVVSKEVCGGTVVAESVLRLYTPNIITTDLVVFLFFLNLIQLTYDSHTVPMPLFSLHIMPHAHLTSFISMQCMAMLFLLLFHSATAMQLPHVLLPFHGHA